MTEFKVGDTVRRKADAGSNGLIGPGEEFEVASVVAATWGLRHPGVIDRNGHWHNAEYVELVSPAFTVPTTPAELQPGDVVRLLPGGSWGSDRESVEHVVKTVLSDEEAITESGWYLYAPDTEDGRDWPWEFVSRPGVYPVAEPVEEPYAGETFDAYTPAMLPMFRKALDEAEARGFCSEFDSMLRLVGAPSREEIKRLTAPALKRYRVTRYEVITSTYEVEAADEAAAEAAAEAEASRRAFDRSRTLEQGAHALPVKVEAL